MDHRILVVGTSCSGKSTFSRRLASILGVEHVEMDALYWGPDWTPRESEVFLSAVEQATASKGWIADGNYSEAAEVVAARVTEVIWLNYFLPTVLWRGLKRTIRRGVRREQLWNGNVESLMDNLFSRESIPAYIVTTHRQRRRRYNRMRRDGAFPGAVWVEFRSPAQAEAYLRRVAARQAISS